uniref:Chromobox 4 n=1 Tax=Chrysemys picta bellii TaxID=8478 RepID=A0A8C3FVL5_CHRPI|nr:E3 SUMO-protein ligase CBX4 isoform X1 [Chrysemys picta bellii]
MPRTARPASRPRVPPAAPGGSGSRPLPSARVRGPLLHTMPLSQRWAPASSGNPGGFLCDLHLAVEPQRGICCGWERQEQLMGYRKRGPKPKPLVVQLPSFARRSNVLTGLQDPAVDNRPKLELNSSGKSQQHQYELNSKKHHQYQPNGKESSMKHQPHSKGKYYYQLNSKKHHHYQPDPKMYEPHYQPSSKEPQSQACLDHSKSPLVTHPDKWAHSPAKSLLSPVKNLATEGKNGAEKNLSSGTGPPSRDGVTSNGIGGKMKIVKNKNKNGRIVIVMSKYMENGMQAVKIKSGEPPRKRTTEERTPRKGGEEKQEAWRKHGEERVAGTDHKSKAGLEGGQPLTELGRSPRKIPPAKEAPPPSEQPLQLTTKPNLVPWSLDPSREHSPAPMGLNLSSPGSRKRCLSEPHEEREPGKKRLTSRSISAPTCLSPQAPERPEHPLPATSQPEVILLDSDLDEPIDLRCVKPRGEGELAVAQVKPEVAQVLTEKPAVEPQQQEADGEGEAEPLQEFKPFFGNIIITDVTANCLTVTFKEYVTV